MVTVRLEQALIEFESLRLQLRPSLVSFCVVIYLLVGQLGGRVAGFLFSITFYLVE